MTQRGGGAGGGGTARRSRGALWLVVLALGASALVVALSEPWDDAPARHDDALSALSPAPAASPAITTGVAELAPTAAATPSPLAAPPAAAASLHVELRDPYGVPRRSESLRLLAVLDDGVRHARHADGRRVESELTDSEGRASFDDLETGVPLRVIPSRPQLRFVDADATPPADDDAPAPSTPALRPGDARSLRLRALPPHTPGLFGRIVDPSGRPVPRLAFEVLCSDAGDGSWADRSRWTTTDMTGTFQVSHSREAEMRLQTSALVNDVDVFSLRHDVHLDADTHLELGSLVLGGDGLHGVRIQARLDGEALRFDELYETPPRVTLALDPVGEHTESTRRVLRDLPVETDLFLHGFPERTYSVQNSLAPDDGFRAEVRAQRAGVDARLTLAPGAPAIAWIDYATQAQLRLTLAGADDPGVRGSLRITLSGPTREHSQGRVLKLPVDASTPLEFDGLRGDYVIVIDHLPPDDRFTDDGLRIPAPPQVQLAGSTNVTLGAQPVEASVQLAPACVLRGRVEAPRWQSSHGGPTLHFELVGVDTAATTSRQLRTWIAQDGSFELSGLPAHTRLQRLREPDVVVVTGAPGTLTDVGKID